jgi:hypothetical protein
MVSDLGNRQAETRLLVNLSRNYGNILCDSDLKGLISKIGTGNKQINLM